MKRWLAMCVVWLLVSCGAPQPQNTAPQHASIVLRAEQLVGMVVELDRKRIEINQSLLVPYAVNMRGVEDLPGEQLQTMVLKVSPGSHRVKITRGDQVLEELTMAFMSGQARELRIRW